MKKKAIRSWNVDVLYCLWMAWYLQRHSFRIADSGQRRKRHLEKNCFLAGTRALLGTHIVSDDSAILKGGTSTNGLVATHGRTWPKGLLLSEGIPVSKPEHSSTDTVPLSKIELDKSRAANCSICFTYFAPAPNSAPLPNTLSSPKVSPAANLAYLPKTVTF